MSEHTTAVWQDNRSTHYRHGRRRWVPKGVMLLAILFVIGLLGACQTAPLQVAAIAVPNDSLESALPVLGEGDQVKGVSVQATPDRVARLSMF